MRGGPESRDGDMTDESIRAGISRGLSLLCQNDARAEALIAPRMESAVSLLAAYVREIAIFNPALSLVGTSDARELVSRHILDSLAPLGIIAGMLDGAGPAHIADVGSGAGLPGIPLAIAMPDARFTLIERKGRRAGFLRSALETLGLANASVEEAEMEKAKPRRFALATFRAFRPLEPKIYGKLARLCAGGGALAAYKGRRAKTEAEMAALENALPSLAGRWELLPCPVPGLEEERHLLAIRPV